MTVWTEEQNSNRTLNTTKGAAPVKGIAPGSANPGYRNYVAQLLCRRALHGDLEGIEEFGGVCGKVLSVFHNEHHLIQAILRHVGGAEAHDGFTLDCHNASGPSVQCDFFV